MAYADSKTDEDLKVQLEKHLFFLRRQGMIETWDQMKLVGGDEVEKEITHQLEEAQIILLLVSVDFFNSPNFEKIREIALRRYADENKPAHVIPVMLRKVYWELSAFAKFKVLPSEKYPVKDRYWQDADEALTIVVNEIMRVVQLLQANKTEQLQDYKSAISIKNVQGAAGSNEKGGLQNTLIEDQEEKHELLDDYLKKTTSSDTFRIADVEFSKAELLLKKAVLLHQEGIIASDTQTQLDKLSRAYQLLQQARRLEPKNIAVLLEMAQILIVLTPDDTSDEAEILQQIEKILGGQMLNEEETFYLAQTRYLLATSDTEKLDLILLKKAREAFQKLGNAEWVSDCDEMIRLAEDRNKKNSPPPLPRQSTPQYGYAMPNTPPPPQPFNPIGNWRVEIHSLIPNTMKLNCYQNGSMDGYQGFLPFSGTWNFQPPYLYLQGYMSGFPVGFGVQIQYEQNGIFHGVGTDGYNYVFHREHAGHQGGSTGSGMRGMR